MSKRQIVNIVNFIRGTEPRVEVDLIEPVREQIRLLRENNLKGTFLLEYDAMRDPTLLGMVRDLPREQFEIGVWFEIVQELAEKAGVVWNGRYSWDWHAQFGFSVGYTLEQRERMIDIFFGEFKEIFGYYPKSLGSWAFDAHTLKYASDKYGMSAFCNCKEQFGTDGYTLWGGYYGQAYYPSEANAHCPAQSKSMQINTPVFKMLGPDPIYQYDLGVNTGNGPQLVQGVVTLEPVYAGAAGGGGSKPWVDWFARENFSGNCLSFGYAQAGQENSFGWPHMRDGLEYQLPLFAKMQREGKLEVETLAESGEWYKRAYSETPASVMAGLSDWAGQGHKSVWYCSKNYRADLYVENDRFWIRDMYLFRENYRERYFDELCDSDKLTFDNLPLVDGNVWSGKGIRAGLYPYVNGEAVTFSGFEYSETGSDTAVVTLSGTQIGDITVTFTPSSLTIKANGTFQLCNKMNPDARMLPDAHLTGSKTMSLSYRDFNYTVKLDKGYFDDICAISSEDGTISVRTAE